VLLAVAVSGCTGNPMGADDDPRPLNATTFLAFGDSITAGVGGIQTLCPGATSLPASPPFTLAEKWLDTQKLIANLATRDGLSYPSFLAQMLSNAHKRQLIKMVNAGVPGEEIADGVSRFPSELINAHPHAVLLLEGVNDINQHGSSTATVIATAYQTMIRNARQLGAEVIVATILPERRGACRGYDWLDGVNDVVIVNARIREVALREGATVLDLYSQFAPRLDVLLGGDGLHPTDPGYQVMAQGFYAAVERLFTR